MNRSIRPKAIARDASLSFVRFAAKSFRRWLAAGSGAALAALTAGCANPGPPRPPSLLLPKVVADLSARRIGDDVRLRWTTPDKTTDGFAIKGVITAEICRETGVAAAAQTVSNHAANDCKPVTRLAVHPGPSQASETLPHELTLDPATLLVYRVQLFNARNRSAGRSAAAFAAGGAAPPAVERLRVTSTKPGAMIEWQPLPAAEAKVELDRVLLSPPAKPPVKPDSTKQPLSLAPPVTPLEVHLLAPRGITDPGGTVDHTAESGMTYSYTAQRVRSVTLDGHTVELRSVPSAAVSAAVRDVFPPDAPTGLEAASGGSGDAAPNGLANGLAIDLSWEPGTDLDLAGYMVYRQEVTSSGAAVGASSRLTPSPVASPAFRDTTVQAGRTYAYRVTAVDAHGNESAPSSAVQETPREQ
jgi:hypothetical protein